VDFGAQEQFIRGFGGSTAWLGQLTTQQATALFSPANGLGLSILRVRIDPKGSAASTDPWATSNWAQEAANGHAASSANANVIVFASPWTPPASMKATSVSQPYSSTCDVSPGFCGGYLDPAHYADYAAYLKDFVTYFNANSSTSLYAISMQNEPDWTTGYESCLWTPAQMDSWIAANASVVTANTKLIMPESLNFNPAQALTALNNPNSENRISIIGGHLYGVTTIGPYSIPSGDSPKELWQTEFGPLNTNTPAFSDALTYARSVHDSMVSGQYNAYVWWGIFGAPTNAGSYGLIDSSTTNPVPTLYGYAIGQYSKFIQPGYYRYNATAKPSANVYVSAYAGIQGGQQHYVIVAINGSASAVNQAFSIQNATVTSMTPYQTTSTTGLAPLSAVDVSGGQLTYSLPAQSITTFVQ
jgi:glucuronoarabinoxylan endo-1,4-beta-xylanase